MNANYIIHTYYLLSSSTIHCYLLTNVILNKWELLEPQPPEAISLRHVWFLKAQEVEAKDDEDRLLFLLASVRIYLYCCTRGFIFEYAKGLK